jgi:hypothetical protein
MSFPESNRTQEVPVPGNNAQGFSSNQEVSDYWYLPQSYKGAASDENEMDDIDNGTDADAEKSDSENCRLHFMNVRGAA